MGMNQIKNNTDLVKRTHLKYRKPSVPGEKVNKKLFAPFRESDYSDKEHIFKSKYQKKNKDSAARLRNDAND